MRSRFSGRNQAKIARNLGLSPRGFSPILPMVFFGCKFRSALDSMSLSLTISVSVNVKSSRPNVTFSMYIKCVTEDKGKLQMLINCSKSNCITPTQTNVQMISSDKGWLPLDTTLYLLIQINRPLICTLFQVIILFSFKRNNYLDSNF